MAEGWARHLLGDLVEPYSAGVSLRPLDPLAVRVMREAGVDISGQRPKLVEALKGERFDWVVTVCDNARETCPVFPGSARHLHASFDDPPALASEARSEEEALAHYRRVRDEIRDFVSRLPERLDST